MEQYWDASARDVADVLVGKSITEIDDDTAILNDGTRVKLISVYDCCAHFTACWESTKAMPENIITAVREKSLEQGKDEYGEAWELHILADSTLVNKILVEGDPTSGYYCHSFTLGVEPPVKR